MSGKGSERQEMGNFCLYQDVRAFAVHELFVSGDRK